MDSGVVVSCLEPLVYGVEAMLPTNLDYGSPRVRAYQEGQNQQSLHQVKRSGKEKI
jgi:hypothetical protein